MPFILSALPNRLRSYSPVDVSIFSILPRSSTHRGYVSAGVLRPPAKEIAAGATMKKIRHPVGFGYLLTTMLDPLGLFKHRCHHHRHQFVIINLGLWGLSFRRFFGLVYHAAYTTKQGRFRGYRRLHEITPGYIPPRGYPPLEKI